MDRAARGWAVAAAFLELDGVVPRPGGGPVTASVPRGGRLVLLGGPGVGKTALLLCIAGFLAPAAGDILLDGRSILKLPPERRRAVLLPAEGALFAHRSLRDNVRFALPGRDRARAEALLAEHGLAAVASLRPAQLSPAQRAQGELVRALAAAPALLLIDAPAAGLSRLEAMETAILATRDGATALAVASTIVLLDAAGVAQIGTPEELYERPASPFAARATGPCNLLPSPAGMLAIRPHRLRIDPAGALSGTIRAIAYAGRETQVRVATDAGELTIYAPPPVRHAPGEAVRVGWNAADAWVLPDAEPQR
jgi:ABC-type Fe3+/spermidine/putrescine transport system ATPase subunit